MDKVWFRRGITNKEFLIVVAIVAVTFLVRFLFFSNIGYINDTRTFEYWFRTASTYGPRVFYDVVSWCDYPPLNVYIFWVFGMIAEGLSVFGSRFFVYVMKLPPNLFDLATIVLVFVFVRKFAGFKKALLACGLYASNIAVFFNVAIWGQFDAIYTFFLILMLYLFLSSKPKLAVISYILAVLLKPQSIALAPLMFFLVIKQGKLKGLVNSVLVGGLSVFAVILPFRWNNPVTFLSDIYFGAYEGYGFTSVNAFNVWAFGGLWQPESWITFGGGWVMFALVSAFSLFFVYKRYDVSMEVSVLFAAFMLLLGFFMFPTRIHERYLFPAMAVLALMFPLLKKTLILYGVFTVTLFVNQAYVLSFLNADKYIASGDPVVFAVSLINFAGFVYALLLMILELRGKKLGLNVSMRLRKCSNPAGDNLNET